MTSEVSNTHHEAQKLKERVDNPPKFEKVIFGHPHQALDPDQIIAYYIASQANLISLDAPIEFQDEIDPSQIDQTTLAIEGIAKSNIDPKKLNANDGQFFDNDPSDDTPAGTKLYTAYNRRFAANPKAQAIKHLSRWHSFNERRANTQDKSDLPSLAKSLIKELNTHALTALKAKHPEDPKQILVFLSQQIDDILQISNTKFTQEYQSNPIESNQLIENQLAIKRNELQSLISEGQQLQQEARNIQQNILQTEASRLKTAISLTGPQLAMLDFRGIPGDAGGFTQAKNIARERGIEPQVIVLISDHESGPEAGIKLSIQTSELEAGQQTPINYKEILSQRFDHAEQLFGKGWRTQGFGGHQGLTSSPREGGSGLLPEQIWPALKDFFRIPRYTETQFTQLSRDFANKYCGLETVNNIGLTPGNEFTLPEWQLALSLPDSESQNHIIITISESELPLYQEFAENSGLSPSEFRQLLKSKTIISEPEQIAQLRSDKAEQKITQLIEQNFPAETILTELNDLNASMVTNLPPEIKVKILQSIAQDPEAIDSIYNPDNLRFRITHPDIRDWLRDDLEKYKSARYHYLSVPYKVDTLLINPESASQMTPDQTTELTNSLLDIAQSKEYINFISQNKSDNLIRTLLTIATSPTTPANISEQIISSLSINSSDKRDFWITFASRNPNLYNTIRSQSNSFRDKTPDFQSLSTDRLPIQAENHYYFPTSSEIQKIIEDSINLGTPINITILFQIGRDSKQSILEHGFIDSQNQPHPITNLEGEMSINGAISFERSEDLTILTQFAQGLKKAIEQIKQSLPDSQPQINIITNGLPGNMQLKLGIWIGQNDFQNYISFIEFNAQDRQFHQRDQNTINI